MADDRHAQILDAALEVFLRYGYRRATMEDIARQVGVSRPTLYLSFPTKQAVFRAVVDAGQARLLDEVRTHLAAPASLQDRLVEVFETWTVRPFAQLALSPAADELSSDGFTFADDVFAGGLDALVALLADAIAADGEPPGPSAAARARVLTGAARGFKEIARSVDDLRTLMADQITLSLAGFEPR